MASVTGAPRAGEVPRPPCAFQNVCSEPGADRELVTLSRLLLIVLAKSVPQPQAPWGAQSSERLLQEVLQGVGIWAWHSPGCGEGRAAAAWRLGRGGLAERERPLSLCHVLELARKHSFF